MAMQLWGVGSNDVMEDSVGKECSEMRVWSIPISIEQYNNTWISVDTPPVSDESGEIQKDPVFWLGIGYIFFDLSSILLHKCSWVSHFTMISLAYSISSDN